MNSSSKGICPNETSKPPHRTPIPSDPHSLPCIIPLPPSSSPFPSPLTHQQCIQPYFIAAVFSFASGAAKDIQTLLITRFFTGFFDSAPITNTGGVLGDIWSPEQRGVAIVGYAVAVIGGPTIGPVVGGALTSSNLRWRWTEYLAGIVLMAQLILDLLLCDESYAPTLLVYKARRLRHESGNWALHPKVSLVASAVPYLAAG